MRRSHRDIRFTTTDDGVSVAFWEIGEGKPVVLVHNWTISHAELEWNVPSIRSFHQAISERYRLIRLDPRGVGLSGDPPGGWDEETGAQAGVTVQHQCKDIRAVAEALDLQSFALMAVSIQGPVGIEFAATHSDTVSELILYDAVAAIKGSYMASILEADRALRLIEKTGESQLRVPFASWDLLVPATERLDLARLVTSSRDRIGLNSTDHVFEWDSTALLGDVVAPTLVLRSRPPPEVREGLASDARQLLASDARQLASGIPDAQLRVIDGLFTPYFFADQAQVLDAIDGFLTPDRALTRPTGFRTIVFTDIVDSTKFMGRVGDEEGREAMRAVEQRVSDLADRHGGRVIKNLGDGSLVSFSSNTAALRFGLELQSQPDPDSLQLRIGMAAGEPIEEGGDIHGAVVAYASRVADIGDEGEIIASDSVRQLAMGKGFTFTPMGQHDLKGFEEPATVWKVTATDSG